MKLLLPILGALTIGLAASTVYFYNQTLTLKRLPPGLRCNNFNYDYSGATFEGILNYPTAKTLAKNYNDKKQPITAWDPNASIDIKGSEDSKSVWFSLDKMKSFIWSIEQQNCLKGCSHLPLGLRLYYARYPESKDPLWSDILKDVPLQYANRHTVFMVPTFYNAETGVNQDFYPEGEGCNTTLTEWAEIRHNDSIIGYKKDRIPLLFMPVFENLPVPLRPKTVTPPTGNSQNHGGLIPPGDPTGTSF